MDDGMGWGDNGKAKGGFFFFFFLEMLWQRG
jgi:hypothetical protein